MLDKWSPSEKIVARRVYEAGLEHEIAGLLKEFKTRAANAKTQDDIWATEEFLTESRRWLADRYTYSYSHLLVLFAALLREGHVSEGDLAGLDDEKRSFIVGLARR